MILMTDADKFRLFALIGFVLSCVAFFVSDSDSGESRELIVGILALSGFLISGYAVVMWGGKASGMSAWQAWIGIVVGALILYGVVSGAIMDRTMSNVVLDSLDADTRRVVEALSDYRAENGVCPDDLYTLYPTYLSSTDVLTEGNAEVYDYTLASDKSECSISLKAR